MDTDSRVVVQRDVDVVQIPFGNVITLREGMEVTLRQPLAGWRIRSAMAEEAAVETGAAGTGAAETGAAGTGTQAARSGAGVAGSRVARPSRPAPASGDAGALIIAVTAEGFLVHVEARDADALGLERVGGGAAAEEPPVDEERVWEVLRTCYDPEIPVDIVALGLVYGVGVTPGAGGAHVEVRMTLTAPGCSMAGYLKDDIERRLNALPGVGAAWVELVFDPPWDPSRMSDAARLQLGLF